MRAFLIFLVRGAHARLWLTEDRPPLFMGVPFTMAGQLSFGLMLKTAIKQKLIQTEKGENKLGNLTFLVHKGHWYLIGYWITSQIEDKITCGSQAIIKKRPGCIGLPNCQISVKISAIYLLSFNFVYFYCFPFTVGTLKIEIFTVSLKSEKK